MVQKEFNVFQAVFCFVLMYTAIVSGILLRDNPITPIVVGVIAILVLIMLKRRNKVVPSTYSFSWRWVLMILLIELSTYSTFYFIVEIVWSIFQIPENFRMYALSMFSYSILVSSIYIGIVYHDEHVRYNSFGLSSSLEKIYNDYGEIYKLELHQFYDIRNHFAFKWLKRLAIHLIFPVASFICYIAMTYKQMSKVGYGVVGVLSVIAFIFIFKVVLEGREVDKDNKPTLEEIKEN